MKNAISVWEFFMKININEFKTTANMCSLFIAFYETLDTPSKNFLKQKSN